MSRIVSANSIPNQIRRYRDERRFRMRDVAEIMGIESPSGIFRWEEGKLMPSLENYLRLADALNVVPQLLYLELFNEIRNEQKPRKVKFEKHYLISANNISK